MSTIPSPSVRDQVGLTSSEAAERLAQHGPNRLPEPEPRPRWQLFLDQFRNLLIVILIGAAVLAGLVGDWKDTIVIAVVLVINAILGYVQESRAESSLAALKKMLTANAKVRRDGELQVISAEELVVGDLVVVETGDRIPADGELMGARSLEVDESAFTGESVPVGKDDGDSAFMNTVITRGRAEMVVTATGGDTEIGGLADMLADADPGDTPLELQLHGLGKRLAAVAGIAVTAFFSLNLLRGEPLADTVLASVALAVAAIPEGLPAVVTVTLAIGVSQLAKRGAIVKRLASVETLGSTTVICSDKTGTLTLNEMTAKVVVSSGGDARLTGDGYGAAGEVDADASARAGAVDVLRAAALCNDSEVRGEELIGDPTEGALVTAAAKAGIDVAELRASAPRTGEVPFDSARKFMATLHPDGDGGAVLYVKGAPDVLAALSTGGLTDLSSIDEFGDEGLRVLGVASRQVPASLLTSAPTEDDLLPYVEDLTLLGLVGLLDPPRPEARDAIALCSHAGIAVKMITGDHAATATAIASQLGIRGRTVTGRDLDDLSDDDLAAEIDQIGVFARVSPAHKVRLVRILRGNGHVVAMTGDGVNDAPALKQADIGVAMGITGTEVSKEAADMVLTDDNFATIVRAVEGGRTIYSNIVQFVRFQLSTNVGAIITLLGATVTGLPVPFTAIQVLWVNLIMDGPPALALGVDPPRAGTMELPPRTPGGRILTNPRLRQVVFSGTIMAIGTLGVLAWQRSVGTEQHALDMAFTTFVFFQLFNVFNARNELGTAFSKESLRNGKLWLALAVAAVLQVLWVWGDLSALDWVTVLVVASSVLIADELRRAVLRFRTRGATPAPAISNG
jgi:Ca2+-transporting ATPase